MGTINLILQNTNTEPWGKKMLRLRALLVVVVCWTLVMTMTSSIWAGKVDNGDGTVSDTTTGLMWQKEDDLQSRTWTAALSYCETLSLAGYNDWRLPNIAELSTLVAYYTCQPAMDGPFHVRSNERSFLSSSTLPQNPRYAYSIDFYVGFTQGTEKIGDAFAHYARCVRSGPVTPVLVQPYKLSDTGQAKCYGNSQEIPCPQSGEAFYGQDGNYHGPAMTYWDNGDGTVTDLNRGLMWQQGDSQNSVVRTWQQATEYCAALDLGGHTDWYLPAVNELTSLVNIGIPSPSPKINTTFFTQCRASRYWSSSTYASSLDYGWYVRFEEGSVDATTKANTLYVRCTRRLQ
jgi:hypothetical protein